MSGFGVKIVLAKTWGFKGATRKSFGNLDCRPHLQKLQFYEGNIQIRQNSLNCFYQRLEEFLEV